MARFKLSARTIKDLNGENTYMRRWGIELFGYKIKLHQILMPDDDRCQHDHPYWMFRVILWGGYVEEIDCPGLCRCNLELKPGHMSFCPATYTHRITKLRNGHSSWSFVIAGPETREWGFFTKVGWMPWQQFIKVAKTARTLWCK
jgi:hypothetical protein